MKKLISLLLIPFFINIAYAKCNYNFSNIEDAVEKQKKDINNCSTYDLYSNDFTAKIPFIEIGVDFTQLMGHGISSEQFTGVYGNVLVANFWDKYNKYQFNDIQLDNIYAATDLRTKETLLILTDSEDRVIKVVGDQKKNLFIALVKYKHFDLGLLKDPQIYKMYNFYF